MRHTRTFARFTTAITAASVTESSAAVLRGASFESPIALAANAPLTLDDPGMLWVVVSGEVDLFHVRSASDAYLASRRYIGTLWAGEVVAGALREDRNEDSVLVAVGFGDATLQAVPRSLLSDTTPEGTRVARALAMGIAETIGRAMHRASRASARPISPADDSVTLTKGRAITAAGDVVWIGVDSGTLSFGGRVEMHPGSGFLPLARGMWLTVSSESATVTCVPPALAFGTTNLDEALRDTWATFLAWVVSRSHLDDEADRGRLALKLEGERRLQERAIAGLAGLLRTDGVAPVRELAGDALLDACQAVGAAAGIMFRAPPGAGASRNGKRDKSTDPVSAIANASRVRSRKVVLRDAWYRRDAGPLLGFLGDMHAPVALLPTGSGGYSVYDPSADRRVPLTSALAARLDPFAYTFYRPTPSAPISMGVLGRVTLGDVWPDLRRVIGLVFIGATLGLALPVITGKMFNDVIPSAAMGNALTLFGALIAVAIGSASFDLARGLALIRVEGRSNAILQAAIVDRLLALPPQFFRQYSVGDLAARADAINAARQLLTGVVVTSLLGGALAITSLGLMWYYSAKLVLVALGAMLAGSAATALVTFYTLPFERRRQALHGKINALVFELLGGIAKLHVAAAEPRMFALWGKQFRELKAVAFRAGIGAATLTVFNDLLPLVASATLYVVAIKVFAGPTGLATGDFIAFNAAFGTALAAGTGVSNTLVWVLNVVPLLERAGPILSTAPEVDDAKPDAGPITGRIEVAHATFGYIPGAPPILDDVSFQIRPGEFVAFVGPSGAGKSTILRLLLGFERPERGAVYYDGHDLASIDVGSIRRQSAVVLQQSKLLAGDIFTNIIGASPLSMDDAWNAAELAGLADDIRKMPMGMHTVVSEGGSTLSGGQRQRLLIARALVRNPRVVFFDEATSALDNRSQDIVTRSLERMHASRIVIAHRLTTVQRADRIFVMQAGKIVQQGRYDELMAAEGLFQQLAQRQLV